ncbi:Uridine kinase, type 2 [Candidatus Syntrophocurvum alkaliphilum]|uniref:Uridine kinase, type 2 n=1 Tax=Candidatus Syntrophocurvum alkaliphilum TaxID=2293317 RepID=A0A6I6DIL9_9FIRM|nr:nucleoside kinase [Candidatus Syntrophocurvum alkaliphilum]QGT99714.1 Uridine kinase, type 2 [Candidatus Syntrophocurvum alkaliphilum]
MTNPKNNIEIEINIKNYGLIKVESGITLRNFCSQIESKLALPPVAGLIEKSLVDLNYRFEKPCTVELIDITSEMGLRVYRWTAAFLLLKASNDLYPHKKLIVRHSLSNGLYCEFEDEEISKDVIENLKNKITDLIAKDIPINRKLINKKEAIKIFEQQEQLDKVRLLNFRDKVNVHVYELDGFYEYSYGFMLPSTGMVDKFKLLQYKPGLILQTPEKDDPTTIKDYIEQPKLANIFNESKSWAKMLNTPHVAALNDIIENSDIGDIIRVNEALHEKKIASFADMICNDSNIRLVLISGPSSSGKTTLAQRLLVQLRVNGRRPVSISLDNYFVDRELTPKDENGDYDFEALEALKLDLFNEHLIKLIKGEEVEIPIYNFKTGKAEPYGVPLSVPEGEPIIIEGIHALNERLTKSIFKDKKFKIYISALTQLNLDTTNRIPTTDCRLIRRMVRDSRTRGYSALGTISRWPSVRRGEDKNIFPFQEQADVIFNSSLVYELSALKIQAENLLKNIDNSKPEYTEAQRLLKFLSYFRPIETDDIPNNSILREFIGGSCFKH